MEYTIQKEGEWLVVEVHGAVNFSNIEILKELFEKVQQKNEKLVRLNLRMVPVMNSAGLRYLLMLYKSLQERGGELVICDIHEILAEMLRRLQIDKLIKIEKE